MRTHLWAPVGAPARPIIAGAPVPWPINLPTDAATSDLLLSVHFKPYIHEEKLPQQRIRVSVNGKQLAEWLVSRFEIQGDSIRIPAELAQEDALRISSTSPMQFHPRRSILVPMQEF